MKDIKEKKRINPSQITLGIFLLTLIAVTADQSIMIILAKFIPKIAASNSSTLYGLAASFFSFGSILMTYPLAKWSQKIGRKKILIFAFFIRIIGILILFFAQNLWMIYLARLIIGFCATTAVIGALIHDHFPPEKRGLPLGVNSVALIVGYLMGSILGGVLYTIFGDRTSFLLLDALTILILLIILLFIKDKPDFFNKEDKPKNLGLITVMKTHLFRDKALFGSFIMTFINNIVFGGIGTYAIYMIFVYYEIPEIRGGLLIIIPTILEAIIFIGVGAKVKNFTKFYKWAIFSMIFVICSTFGFIFYTELWFFVSIGSLIGMSIAGMIQSTDTISISLIPEEVKSELLGIYRIITILGNIIGPALFGLMVDYLWPFLPGFLMLALILVSMFIYMKLIKKSQIDENG